MMETNLNAAINAIIEEIKALGRKSDTEEPTASLTGAVSPFKSSLEMEIMRKIEVGKDLYELINKRNLNMATDIDPMIKSIREEIEAMKRKIDTVGELLKFGDHILEDIFKFAGIDTKETEAEDKNEENDNPEMRRYLVKVCEEFKRPIEQEIRSKTNLMEELIRRKGLMPRGR